MRLEKVVLLCEWFVASGAVGLLGELFSFESGKMNFLQENFRKN